jgi:hypothetical protein
MYVKKAFTEVGSAAARREDKKVENIAFCQTITILCPPIWHLWSSRHQAKGGFRGNK